MDKGEIRKLLRSIEDPVAMSRNHLVSALFRSPYDRATYTQVRAALLAAVELLLPPESSHADVAVHRRRQYEIVKRYDLGDATMEELLERLCIERSQFYRERGCALEWLAEWMRRYVEETCEEDPELLRRLARTREDPLERARCLLRMAEINVATNSSEARASAEEAMRLLDAAAG